jgi:hypothetical protein
VATHDHSLEFSCFGPIRERPQAGEPRGDDGTEFALMRRQEVGSMGRAFILWLLGVPASVLVVLWLIGFFH